MRESVLSSSQRPRAKPLAGLAAGYALLALALFVTGFLLRPMLAGGPPPLPGLEGVVLPRPVPVPAFSLEQAAAGSGAEPYTRARLLHRWTLMYFGYANCPDGCPGYLAAMAGLAHNLDALQRSSRPAQLAQLAQLVFVTIDPARDTAAALSAFLSPIDAGIVGLRGSEGQVAALAGALGMLYSRRPGSAGGGYRMDHPATILLIDPRARLRAGFDMPREAAGMAALIAAMMSEYDAGVDG